MLRMSLFAVPPLVLFSFRVAGLSQFRFHSGNLPGWFPVVIFIRCNPRWFFCGLIAPYCSPRIGVVISACCLVFAHAFLCCALTWAVPARLSAPRLYPSLLSRVVIPPVLPCISPWILWFFLVSWSRCSRLPLYPVMLDIPLTPSNPV